MPKKDEVGGAEDRESGRGFIAAGVPKIEKVGGVLPTENGNGKAKRSTISPGFGFA